MGEEIFLEIVIYRPGTFVRCIPVTAGWLFCASFKNLNRQTQKIDGSTFTFQLGLIVEYVLTFVKETITPPV